MHSRRSAPRLAILLLLAFCFPALSEPIYPPGSAWGIEPPSGYRVGTSSPFVFEHPSGATIMVTVSEKPHDRANVTAAGSIVGQGDEARKIDALTNVTANGRPGMLMLSHMVNEPTEMMTLMVQGETAGLIIAIIPTSAATAIDKTALRAALFTARERRLGTAEKLEAAPVKIATIDGMRISDTIPGSGVILTDGPLNETADAPAQAFMMIICASVDNTGPLVPSRDKSWFGQRFAETMGDMTSKASRERKVGATPIIEATYAKKDGSMSREGVVWARTLGKYNIYITMDAAVGKQPEMARLERVFMGVAEK